jgi:hypothetical protein
MNESSKRKKGNKKLNRRGRRARRVQNGQKLKGQRGRGKAGLFPTLSARPKMARGFQKMNSALSASSSVIFLPSSAEDTGKERFLFPKMRK